MITLSVTVTNDQASSFIAFLRIVEDAAIESLLSDAVRLEPGDEDQLTKAFAVARQLHTQLRQHQDAIQEADARDYKAKPHKSHKDIVQRGRAIILQRRTRSITDSRT
jgi:hypothetical protein